MPALWYGRGMIAQVIQCALACIYGCTIYVLLMDDPNPKVPLFAALIAGFGGCWLTMFLYFWARFGWQAARSMNMSP